LISNFHIEVNEIIKALINILTYVPPYGVA